MEPGTYVLATKYEDGDPCDHFAIGIIGDPPTFPYPSGDRFNVVDGNNQPFRANGFRQVERITPSEGEALLAMFPEIGDRPGPSLWDQLAAMRDLPPKETNNETN